MICAHCQDGFHQGCCDCCFDDRQPEPQQTMEEYCAAMGHAYYGDAYPDAPDGDGGSCYCGRNTYPTGGPRPS
jgi:hypothetical protein